MNDQQSKILEKRMYQEMENLIDYGKKRYARWIEAARKARPNLSPLMEANIVKCLKATEEEMRKYYRGDVVTKYIREAGVTRPTDIDSFINYAFDVITASIPASPIEEFATIQSIDRRVGEIFFMDIVKKSTKGTTHTSGDNYLAAQTGPNTGYDYSSERIGLEETGFEGDGSTLAFTGENLDWLPIKAYNSTTPYSSYSGVSLRFTINGTTYNKLDNGSGAFAADTNIVSGTINYTTGALAVTFQAGRAPDNGTKIYATYWHDSAREDVNQNNDVILQLSSAIVVAQRRFLNTRWMIDSALMLQKEHGKDIEAELTEKVLAGVMNESAIEMANRLYEDAAILDSGSAYEFDKTPPSVTIPYTTHRQEILGTIGIMATDIESTVRKVTANFVIGGSDFVKVIKGLPKDLFDAVKYVDKTPVGMHVIGVLDNQYKVIQNFDYSSEQFLVGAKGPDWMTTGAVWCPFIPLFATPINWNTAGDQWRSLLQYAAIHVVNSSFYAAGEVTAS